MVKNKPAQIIEGRFETVDLEGDAFVGDKKIGEKRDIDNVIEVLMGEKDMLDCKNIVLKCIDEIARIDNTMITDL
ncbi:hypothetical protein, partial [Sulfuricurvum sp.]|uniref:hypothetical protein n=1 Tax=Sulfuricurvum sp. TaxID=2025608 RepID=UPI0019B53F60